MGTEKHAGASRDDRSRDLPAALTIKQAARVLQIDPRFCYRLARAGQLPGAVKLGTRSWRVRTAVLVAWLEADATAEGGDAA